MDFKSMEKLVSVQEIVDDAKQLLSDDLSKPICHSQGILPSNSKLKNIRKNYQKDFNSYLSLRS